MSFDSAELAKEIALRGLMVVFNIGRFKRMMRGGMWRVRESAWSTIDRSQLKLKRK